MIVYNVTYEKWDDVAVEAGDTDERGFVAENVSLSEAIRMLYASAIRDVQGGFIECHDEGVALHTGRDLFSGDMEVRTLHRPRSMGDRVWRLVCMRCEEWLC